MDGTAHVKLQSISIDFDRFDEFKILCFLANWSTEHELDPINQTKCLRLPPYTNQCEYTGCAKILLEKEHFSYPHVKWLFPFWVKLQQLDLISEAFRKLIDVSIPNNIKIAENCTFSRNIRSYSGRKKRKFFVTLSLPLTEKGFRYRFKNLENFINSGRISPYWFLQKEIKRSFSVSNNLTFSKYLNNLRNLIVPSNDDDMLNYVKNSLKKNLGQNFVGGAKAREEFKN